MNNKKADTICRVMFLSTFGIFCVAIYFKNAYILFSCFIVIGLAVLFGLIDFEKIRGKQNAL